MFNVFVRGIDDPKDIISDVNLAFSELTLCGDSNEEMILDTIDEARFWDSMHFLDRNGAKTDISHLSTGAKAALLVYYNPNRTINGYSCNVGDWLIVAFESTRTFSLGIAVRKRDFEAGTAQIDEVEHVA